MSLDEITPPPDQRPAGERKTAENSPMLPPPGKRGFQQKYLSSLDKMDYPSSDCSDFYNWYLGIKVYLPITMLLKVLVHSRG